MGAGNGTDFLNSDFPMWAAGGVATFAIYRAFVVRVLLLQKRPYEIHTARASLVLFPFHVAAVIVSTSPHVTTPRNGV